MYDTNKVLVGIAIFIVVMTSPFWLNAGQKVDAPKPELPVAEKKCIASKEFMRANHMQVLEEWRTEAVRHNERDYTTEDGRHYKKSLTLTCLDCHRNKKNFCDKCHDYAGVVPYCFTCHVALEVNQ